ncbi:MAG: hypothetical protein KKB77_01640 [Bacteroidetes bacterium]|nr:hypothetical protein [Bacteroidota bacterium]MBU2442603.1 hypothetical protein [Nanoarchaeota archaeon]
MINLRIELIKEFKKIITDEKIKELFHLLNQGNYSIELTYTLGVQSSFKDISDSEVPFGFISLNKFIETREELILLRGREKAEIILSRIEIAEDISKISRYLDTLSTIGTFSGVEKLLRTFYKDFHKDMDQILEQEGRCADVCPYVYMKLNGIMVLGIDIEGENDVGETSVNIILEKLPIDSDLVKIADQGWFHKLDYNAQQLIKSGILIIEKCFSELGKESILDYSPLLVDFIKAVEVEINEHFRTFSGRILDTAKYLEKNLKYLEGDGKKDPNLKMVYDLAKSLNQYNVNWRTSGTKPLFILLKHFALGFDLGIIPNFKGYLPDDKLKILQKEIRVVDRIEQLGYDRNKIIHEILIESENEFLMYYNDLVLALKLLANLKI